jgi:hypothetical protein
VSFEEPTKVGSRFSCGGCRLSYVAAVFRQQFAEIISLKSVDCFSLENLKRVGAGNRSKRRGRDRQIEVGNANLALLAEVTGPDHGAFQLPDVARPTVAKQGGLSGRRELRHRPLRRRMPIEEVHGQRQNIGLAVAQRRQLDAENVETVKEVRAKQTP